MGLLDISGSIEVTKNMTEDILSFIENSPDPYAFTREVSKLLTAAGFQEMKEIPSSPEELKQKCFYVFNNCEIAAFNYTGKNKLEEISGDIVFHALVAMPNCDDVVNEQQIVRLSPLDKTETSNFQSIGLRASGIVYYETPDHKIDFKLYDSKMPIAYLPQIPVHFRNQSDELDLDKLFAYVDEPLLTTLSKATGIPEDKITRHKIFFTFSEKPKIVDSQYFGPGVSNAALYPLLQSFIEFSQTNISAENSGLRVLVFSENSRISPKALSFASFVEELVFGEDQIREKKKESPFFKMNVDPYQLFHFSLLPELIDDSDSSEFPYWSIHNPINYLTSPSQGVMVKLIDNIKEMALKYLKNPKSVMGDQNEDENEHEEEIENGNKTDDEDQIDDQIICQETYPEPEIHDYTMSHVRPKSQKVMIGLGITAGVLLAGFVIYKIVKKHKNNK